MNIVEQAEIHFHQQEQLSVFLESNSSENLEKAGEIGLFTMFALRMMSNLDVCETTENLGKFLMGAEGAIPTLASGKATGGFQLVPYPGHAGRKQFVLKFDLTDSQLKFDLDAKGFGWFATGMGYYGPIAVIGLLRQLALKRAGDPEFLQRIACAATSCGQSQLQRKISLQNQTQLGFNFLTTACGPYLSGPSKSPNDFDKIWVGACQYLIVRGGECPRASLVRAVSFTGSVNAVFRQLCFEGPADSPFSKEVRERMSSWSVDEALGFAGTLHIFVLCVMFTTADAESWAAALQGYGGVYGLSDEEVFGWQDFTLKNIENENTFPTKLNNRLASTVSPMVRMPETSTITAGMAWGTIVSSVLDEFNRRLDDPKWLSLVDGMIGN